MATAATPILANPGQTIRLVVQTLDGYGNRVDGYVPQVTKVFFPDESIASGYPQAMTKIDTGLYAHGAILGALLARSKSGKGQKIDVSLLECQVANLANIDSLNIANPVLDGTIGSSCL